MCVCLFCFFHRNGRSVHGFSDVFFPKSLETRTLPRPREQIGTDMHEAISIFKFHNLGE